MLKLDLQGGELEALEGARYLLSRENIAIVYTEAVFIQKYEHQPLLRDLWSHLSAHGYRLHSLHDIKTGSYGRDQNLFRNTQYNQCDAVFISNALANLLES
ncbi:MAG: FkbM family methyltransferase, partial [Cyanobium sp.]